MPHNVLGIFTNYFDILTYCELAVKAVARDARTKIVNVRVMSKDIAQCTYETVAKHARV